MHAPGGRSGTGRRRGGTASARARARTREVRVRQMRRPMCGSICVHLAASAAGPDTTPIPATTVMMIRRRKYQTSDLMGPSDVALYFLQGMLQLRCASDIRTNR